MRTPPSPLDTTPLSQPNPARMYNYLLGGFHHLAIDRQAAEAALQVYPDIALLAHVNRAFLRRVVTCLLAHGIRQFLDLGSGLPTIGCIHEVAYAHAPESRVVYVDTDPLTVAHGRKLLQAIGTTTMLQADLRQMRQILRHPEVQRLLDVRQPIAVLLLTLLLFLPRDADAYGLLEELGAALAPGSYVALAHAAIEHLPGERRQALQQLGPIFARSTNPGTARTPAQIARFFTGLELIAPGLVFVPLWRPEGPDDLFVDQPERSLLLGGVGRKRA
jgi:O-methyltransferase involved in polyketide biosynthesis